MRYYLIKAIALLSLLSISLVYAAERTVNLTVSYKTVNFTGKSARAIAVNDQIPGPTLRFKQGDHVTINVYNCLDKGTSIHWHGLLVPWQMDGVEGVTQKPIPPGGVFHYKFTLYQSGTYWYHAHSHLQEQEGLYGAFLIDPPTSAPYKYMKDKVIVLSDWSNLAADKVYRNLKKDGDYFSPRMPLQPSLTRFLRDYSHATTVQRKKILSDYLMMQKMRMSIYDISDVAYDAFLLNGQSKTNPWVTLVKVGDIVRLRFIGASASTIYRVKIPGATLQIVQIDGNNVRPYAVEYFTIAPGETYDVLIHVKKRQPYIIYAESSDTVGAAVGALITNSRQTPNFKNITPFPEPPPVTMMPMSMDMSMDMDMEKGMDMGMSMQHTNHDPISKASETTTNTEYQNLVAAVKTNNPHKPIEQVIHMELFGWMNNYIWFINGLPEYRAKPILIQPGKRYRLIFTNTSMMNHPMHIHGHWFILRNGHGAYDPLMHTIVVPPGAVAVADVDADASGQWFFHCHHLYHMMAGMARVFQYTTLMELVEGKIKPASYVAATPYVNREIVRKDEVLPLIPELIHHPQGHHQGFYFANFLDIGEDPFHNIQALNFKGLYGTDYHKLELLAKDAELNKGKVENADIDLFYWHPIAQFWAIKAGVNYFNQPAATPYWQPGIGIEGLIPYFIDMDSRIYYFDGSVKFDAELMRDTQITNNFFIRLGIRSICATKTVTRAHIGSGLNQMRYAIRPYYRVAPGIDIFFQYEYEKNYGAFKNFELQEGEPAVENVTTFGLAFVF